jgi:hypothetical protein
MAEIGPWHVEQVRDLLDKFRDDVSVYVREQGVLPQTGSPGFVEREAFSDPGAVQSAFAQAALLLEIAADQLTAFVKTITEPVETIAPWTCARSLLEACALGAWLLDPNIDVTQRVGRGIALRLEGLQQQLKYAKVVGKGVDHAASRIKSVVEEGKLIGLHPVFDNRRRLIAVGQPMPSVTDLMRDHLNEEATYRLLSAVAHGHHWATTQIGFKLLPKDPSRTDPPGLRALVKAPMNPGMVYLGRTSALAIIEYLRRQAGYCGWDWPKLSIILNGVVDRFNDITRDVGPNSGPLG